MDGDVATARRLLGRPFRVTGEVVHGRHLGRVIGFPTANVAPPIGQAPLADGIYAAWAWLPDDTSPRPAVAYVGSRPTVDDGDRMVETHLLDFEGDLYGQTLATDLLERIRADARFDSLADLIARMTIDKAQARDVLAAEGGGVGVARKRPHPRRYPHLDYQSRGDARRVGNLALGSGTLSLERPTPHTSHPSLPIAYTYHPSRLMPRAAPPRLKRSAAPASAAAIFRRPYAATCHPRTYVQFHPRCPISPSSKCLYT